MALFEVPKRPTSTIDTKILNSVKTVAKPTPKIRRGGNLASQVSEIVDVVKRNLGQFESETLIIRDNYELHSYISKSIENGVISIDTETTGLDPIQDIIAGVCIYTPGEKTAYVPINHVSYLTSTRLDNQLTEDQVSKEFKRLEESHTKVIMFNAPFDIRVLRNQLNVYLECYWDCYLGARLLNENEESNALKKLHQKYVLDGVGDAFKYDELFKGMTFTFIPIDVASLYAAHDAIITYELYKFQEPYLSLEQDREDLRRVAWVFRNIEMPLVDVISDMEDTGVDFDIEYAQELSEKYTKILNDKQEEFKKELEKYSSEIKKYEFNNSGKIDNPINIASSSQLSILFYDILKIPPIDQKSPRGTGVEILSKMDNELARIVLDYREVSKLLSTYIDKLPLVVNNKTNRIHCKFNQYGADTGRFSSSDPKQNWAIA